MNFSILQLGSNLVGIGAFALLTAFLLVNLVRRVTGKAVLTASVLTLLWTISSWWYGFSPVVLILESVVLLAWLTFLLRVIGQRSERADKADIILNLYWSAIAIACISVGLVIWLPSDIYIQSNQVLSIPYVLLLFLDIIGLIFLEQVIRNTKDIYRWRQRYLSIALGTVFGYSLVVHATAVMFSAPLPGLAILQPLVYGLSAPFIAISALRNRNNPLRVNLSREFVFRSGVLSIIGLFLLCLGITGYYAKFFEGDWGTAIVALVGTIGGIGLATVIGSSRTRRHLKVLIAKTLFEYKYDYRNEWLRVTRLLGEKNRDYTLPQQTLRALMGILNSDQGTIWRLNESQLFVPIGNLSERWDRPLSRKLSDALNTLYSNYNWVLDLNEIAKEIEPFFQEIHPAEECEEVRYLIPLFAGSSLFGIAMLNRPLVFNRLEWEDFDVLKLIANQSAHVLALKQADSDLRDAEQLKAFQQLSAFLVHDIKTISAQLSLLVQNSQRHRDNPDFIDDMIDTTRNAVDRMQKLLSQLNDERDSRKEIVDVLGLTEKTVNSFKDKKPIPTMQTITKVAKANINATQYQAALGHLIQNAVDATDESGSILISLTVSNNWIEVNILDSGHGMDAEFLRDQLFQPFSSTKGLSGMGIGVYQAREYLRGMGGDITVSSELNVGTEFIMRLPKAA